MLKINSSQKKILKISILIFTVMISSLLFTNSVSAVSSDTYDMSSWIDVSEFTLPNSTITPEDYYIVIFQRVESLGYRLVYWKKDLDSSIYVSSFNEGGVFPNTGNISIFYGNDSWKNLNYYDETSAFSKTFKSSKTGSNSTFSTEKLIYSNVDIWYQFDNGSSAYKWFDLSKVSYEPTSYEFNEDIDVTDISKIKINFELPEDTSNLELSLYYSINALSNNSGLIGVPYISLTSKNENNYDVVDIIDSNYGIVERNNLISNMCDIVSCWDVFDSTKYNKTFQTCIDNLEQIDSTDINSSRLVKEELSNWYAEEYVNKLYDLALSLVNKSYIKNISYSNNFNMSLLPDSSVYKYSLEIDTVDYDGILNLNFISNLNYSIEYDYVIDNEDYYLTIDMSNYAALILIPKVFDTGTNISSSFLSNIYLNGIYDIELWENLESKTVLQRYNNFNKNIFSSYFHRLYNSSILYFINKNFGDDNYYIKFDSRYYNYSLKKTLSEEVIIVNPNTGENITIPDISDLYYYGTNKDNRFSFDSFLKPIKFVFESITNFYNNYCPTLVQYFLYLIFAFFVILVLIKVFL